MLKRKEVELVLNRFGEDVVKRSRSNLLGHNASGRGAKSIEYDVTVHPNSFEMSFSMEAYMDFQDKGVKGTKSGTSIAGYRFGTGSSRKENKKDGGWTSFRLSINGWMIKKGIAPRSADGKFMSRKSLIYLITRKIYQHGITPKKFFTKAFNEEFKSLPDEIIEAYALDAERLMQSTLNTKNDKAID